MRPSSKRHPVAVLRIFLKLGQKEFADMIGCSVSTIQSIELGKNRLNLSNDLAMRIGINTGVSIGWLLDGDPKAPIVTGRNSSYSLEDFERAQVNKTREVIGFESHAQLLAVLASSIFRILKSAAKDGQHGIAYYRVSTAISAVAKSLNIDADLSSLTDDEMRDLPAILEAGAEWLPQRFAFVRDEKRMEDHDVESRLRREAEEARAKADKKRVVFKAAERRALIDEAALRHYERTTPPAAQSSAKPPPKASKPKTARRRPSSPKPGNARKASAYRSGAQAPRR